KHQARFYLRGNILSMNLKEIIVTLLLSFILFLLSGFLIGGTVKSQRLLPTKIWYFPSAIIRNFLLGYFKHLFPMLGISMLPRAGFELAIVPFCLIAGINIQRRTDGPKIHIQVKIQCRGDVMCA